MLRLVILFALLSCTFAGTFSNDFVGRIVNGTDTTIQRHPYQVSLQTNSGYLKCGGAVINPDTIVTAGHCVYNRNPSNYKIRLGSTEYNKGGELVEIKAFRIHEQFNDQTDLNDIGIIKLARPIRESDTVRYVELATKTPQNGTPAVVTGWGTKCYESCNEYPAILQEVELKIVDEKQCAVLDGPEIQPSMLCAYADNKDACQGDSGSPLVAESKLVGVVSWGFGCADEGQPGVYANVAYFHKWILDTVKSL